MRRRALIGAMLLIGVGVLLGATVFRTDIAGATGLDKAAQNVIVKNTPEQAVPVQQAGTPWSRAMGSQNNVATSFTVPADKRLVIQFVNGFYTVGTGFSPIAFLDVTSGGASARFDFLGTTLPNAVSRYEFSQQVTIYVDPGTTVKWTFPGSGEGDIQLSGYLRPA